MKFDGVLFVSDVDGTLVGPNDKISSLNIDAIKYFTDNGGRFTLATGRTNEDLSRIVSQININAPVITQNGARIYDFETEKTIFEINLSDDVEKIVEKIVSDAKYTSVEFINENERYVFNKNEGTDVHLEHVPFTPIYIDDWHKAPKPWARIAMWTNPTNMNKLLEFMKTNKTGDDYSYMRTGHWSCEVVNSNADKFSGVLKLKEILKDIKFVSAIGDNQNDMEMLKNADLSFAPKDSFDYAKASANFVTEKTAPEGAIYDAINELALHI